MLLKLVRGTTVRNQFSGVLIGCHGCALSAGWRFSAAIKKLILAPLPRARKKKARYTALSCTLTVLGDAFTEYENAVPASA